MLFLIASITITNINCFDSCDMKPTTKRHINILFIVITGMFFIVLGTWHLMSPGHNLDNLVGVLMVIYGLGSIALFPDWKGNN